MVIHLHSVWLLPIIALCAQAVDAAALKNGHVAEVVRDVQITQSGAAPMPAKVNAAVRDASTIETGRDSRAEIAFGDRTVVRLGDNTHLRVDSHSRSFDLAAGAILTQVPPGVGGTLLKVRNVTATTTGTTLIVESLPQAYTKFISLDGTSRLCLKKGGWRNDCVLIRAGQMLIASPDPKQMPEPVDVDLARLLETSQFITEFSALPGRDRLNKTASAQGRKKSHGGFADTNLVIFGRGTLVSQKNAQDSKSTGASTPTPSPERRPTPTADRPK